MIKTRTPPLYLPFAKDALDNKVTLKTNSTIHTSIAQVLALTLRSSSTLFHDVHLGPFT